jgi:hypothetical protein
VRTSFDLGDEAGDLVQERAHRLDAFLRGLAHQARAEQQVVRGINHAPRFEHMGCRGP